MAGEPLGMAIRRLLRAVSGGSGPGLPDAELLDRFVGQRDEAAVETLLWRHGPMVLSTCRRLLGNHADAEDCFQAVFLVLCRRADTIANRESLGSWLYKVTYRICLRAKAARSRLPLAAASATEPAAPDAVCALELRELRSVLDEELNRLPEKYRAPLVLHYLEGKTVEQAAQELGWRHGTVCTRLARGKEVLRVRLTRRGVTLTAGAIAGVLAQEATAALPAGLPQAALQAATGFVGRGANPAPLTAATRLANGFLQVQLQRRVRWLLVVLFVVGVAGTGTAIALHSQPAEPALRAVGPASDLDNRGDAPVLRDGHGDPLPPGAVLRLGTVRFRHGVGLSAVAYAPDGKTIVSAGDDGLIRLWDAATGKPKGIMRQPGRTGIRTLAFAPDGRTLLTGGFDGDQFPGSKVFLWDMAAGKIARTVQAPSLVVNCAFSPDGRWFATADNEHTVLVWDAATGTRKWQLEVASGRVPAGGPPPRAAVTLAFSPDSKTLAAGGTAGLVRLWSLNDGVVRPGPHTAWNKVNGAELPKQPVRATTQAAVRALAYSPDGATLAIGDGAENVSLWDVKSMKEIAVLPGSASKDRQQGLRKMDPEAIVNNTSVGMHGLSFSPDGKTLAATCADGTIVLTDIATRRQSQSLVVPRPNLFLPWRETCFSSDGRMVVAGTPTGEIFLWDVAAGQRVHPNSAPPMGSCCVAVSPDGNTVAVASRQNAVVLWDAGTGSFFSPMRDHPECCWTAFSPDGALVLTGNAIDHCVRFWDRATGKEVQRINGCEEVVFSPDGKTLFQRMHFNPRAAELEVRRRDGKLLWAVKDDTVLAQSVLCSLDGRYVAYISAANADVGFDKPRGQNGLVIRDASTGRELRFLSGKQASLALTPSPQGERLAAASWDGISVWDTTSWQPLWFSEEKLTAVQSHALSGFTNQPSDSRGGPMHATRPLTFSPDGRLLAAGSTANRIKIWHAATGRVYRTLSGHESRVASLAFTPDGRRLISGSDDTTALIWDLALLGN